MKYTVVHPDGERVKGGNCRRSRNIIYTGFGTFIQSAGDWCWVVDHRFTLELESVDNLNLKNPWIKKLLHQRDLVASIERRLTPQERDRLRKINRMLHPEMY